MFISETLTSTTENSSILGTSVFSEANKHNPKSYLKRQYPNNPKEDTRIIELLVICDYSCFKRHEKILNKPDANTTARHVKAYYSILVKQANGYFERLFSNTSSINIKIQVASFMVLNTKASSRFSTDDSNFLKIDSKLEDDRGRNYLNCDLASPMLNDWLTVQSMENKKFPKFDAAVVFSFTNIFSSDTDIVGYTVIKGLCNLGTNGIIIEETGFSSVKTLVHELSHSIGKFYCDPREIEVNSNFRFKIKGIEHDIVYNSTACSDDANFIMSTSTKPENVLNSFYFSPCSIENFVKIFIEKNEWKCLLKDGSDTSEDDSKMDRFLPGQLYDANEQCKQNFGETFELMFVFIVSFYPFLLIAFNLSFFLF